MDISMYPNLASIGLIKEVKLNKKIYANLQENLSMITHEEFLRIDSELPYATTMGGLMIMPTAIIKLDGLKTKHIMDIILCKDLIYVWGNSLTMRMNFIPYHKTHTVHMICRNSKTLSSDQLSTGGFSKKDVIGPIVDAIRCAVEPNYPGVFYGWTKEREDAMCKNFASMVQAVDNVRGVQPYQY